MSIPERMIVSATVKSRGEEAEGFKLELDIPQFRSKFPTTVTRVPESVAKILTPRPEPYNVVLLRENLKKDKTGTQPYDYYWGLEGLATPAETAAKAKEPDPLDERDHRIMRSTALAQAVSFGAYLPENQLTYLTVEDVLHIAGVFYAWLRDGPPKQTQDRPHASQDEAPAPAPVVGDVLTREGVIAWACTDGWYAGPQDMAKVPGVKDAMKANNFAEAKRLLEEARV